MKTAVTRSPVSQSGAAATEGAHMGSEYMDARSYLKQPVRAPRVKDSDPTFHGSNESEFLPEELRAK